MQSIEVPTSLYITVDMTVAFASADGVEAGIATCMPILRLAPPPSALTEIVYGWLLSFFSPWYREMTTRTFSSVGSFAGAAACGATGAAAGGAGCCARTTPLGIARNASAIDRAKCLITVRLLLSARRVLHSS